MILICKVYIFKKGKSNCHIKLKVIFKNKHRKTFICTYILTRYITEIFKTHLAPNKTTIFPTDKFFN